MLQTISIFYLITFERTKSGSYIFPIAADVIGWLMIVVSIIPIFVYMAWSFYHKEGNWKQVSHCL